MEAPTGFIAQCECGALVWTSSLSGELELNQHGWGVWSTPHPAECSAVDASEFCWHRMEYSDYRFVVDLAKKIDDTKELIRSFLRKETSFASLREAVGE